jgi:hypothetical protein
VLKLTIRERRRRVFRYCRDALHAVAFPHSAQPDKSKSFTKISREQHTRCLGSEGLPNEKFETIQQADRGVRQVWKLRSVRISAETGKPSGYLWHYGHFIHDLIMPLADWLVEGSIDPEAIELFIEHTPDQSVGPYVDLIRSLLGVRAKLVTPQRFKNLDGKDLALHAYLFGPYKPSSLENVQQLVLSRFDLRPVAANSPEVILIERGYHPSGFEDSQEIPESSKKNGKQRRMIVNHGELSAALDARYGRRFCGVVLEEIPVAEQIRLFHHARLVIGQHGGGLNNLIWMKGNDGVVVELAPTAIKTFQNLCLAKGLIYRTLGPMNRRMPRIDSAELLHLLDSLGC